MTNKLKFRLEVYVARGVSEFIKTFSSSSIGADFFEKVGIDEYNQLLREEERGRKKQRKSRSCFREEKVDYSATNWGLRDDLQPILWYKNRIRIKENCFADVLEFFHFSISM